MLQDKDRIAVNKMAIKMKEKLADADAKGKVGWDDPGRCSTNMLVRLLMKAVNEADFVSVANYAMMLEARDTPAYTVKLVAGHYFIDSLYGVAP